MNIHQQTLFGKWIALNNLREWQTFWCKKSRHQLGKVGKSPLYLKSNVYKNQSFMNASFLHSVYLFVIIHKCKLNKIFKNIMHREMEKFLNIHDKYILELLSNEFIWIYFSYRFIHLNYRTLIQENESLLRYL